MTQHRYTRWLPLALLTTLHPSSRIHAQTTTDPCDSELAVYAACVVDLPTEQQMTLCDSCRLEAESVIPIDSTCDFQNSIVCTAVNICDCGPCDAALLDYFTCQSAEVSDCAVDCPTDCPNSFDNYRNCVYRLDSENGKACDDCRLDAAAVFADGGMCADVQTAYCAAVTDTCDTCGECDDELENYLACDVLSASEGNCLVDCGTVATPIDDRPLCEEFTAYESCMAENLPELAGCEECRLQAALSLGPESTCEERESTFCNAVATCDCGVCTAPLEAYWYCDVSKRTFGECNIDCATTTAPVASAPASLAPVISTDAPATMAPVTSTDAPAAVPPVASTDTPATMVPVASTDAPATMVPVTSTDAPASMAPAASVLSTAAPFTSFSSTSAPTSEETTAAPLQQAMSSVPAATIPSENTGNMAPNVETSPVTPSLSPVEGAQSLTSSASGRLSAWWWFYVVVSTGGSVAIVLFAQ